MLDEDLFIGRATAQVAGLSRQNLGSIAGQSMWDLWQTGNAAGFSPSTWVSLCAGITQSVQWLATVWAVRISNPSGVRDISQPSWRTVGLIQAPSCTKSTGSFLWLQRPGCDLNHLPSSSAKVKERVEQELFTFFVPRTHLRETGQMYRPLLRKMYLNA